MWHISDRLASLGDGVGLVVRVGASEEVPRIDARRVVAVVENAKPVRNRPIG